MQTQAFNTNSLTKKARSQLAQFAIEASIDYQYKEKQIEEHDNLSTTDIILRLKFDQGQIVNRANTVSIVFDTDLLRDEYKFNQDLVDHPADSFEEKHDDGHKNIQFEFGNGGALISEEYLELAEGIYGFDLRENPERILGREDQDNWPVKIEDKDAGTYMLIAPRVMPDE